jgi:putative PIN family toxin of toxin-antitoxin system
MRGLISSRPQVVIDTNVWISGVVFGGAPKRVLELFIDGSIVVVISEEILSELRRKINQKFPLFVPQLPLLEASIREKALFVKLGSQPVVASRDKDDDKFIETAIAGRAGYIVSGDKDLLVLKFYENVKIVKPAEFLATFA